MHAIKGIPLLSTDPSSESWHYKASFITFDLDTYIVMYECVQRETRRVYSILMEEDIDGFSGWKIGPK